MLVQITPYPQALLRAADNYICGVKKTAAAKVQTQNAKTHLNTLNTFYLLRWMIHI